MNTAKIRIWAFLLMLLACSFVYHSAASSLPVASGAAPISAWML
jgi:hypothetical protein